MANSIRLFEQVSHAADYSLFRPTYSKSILQLLLGYVGRRGGACHTALDVACGSGQSTFFLSGEFESCIGVDISPEQIKQAKSLTRQTGVSNVSFQVADARSLPLPDSSVDLLTMATGWHWIPDKEKLYSECKRVLKPKGCLAAYVYDLVQTKDAALNELIYSFYAKLDQYWHNEFDHIKNEYKDVILPFLNVERVQSVMTCHTSLSGLMGFISSWSGYRAYREACPGEAEAELEELRKEAESRLDKLEGASGLQRRKLQANHFNTESLNTFYLVNMILAQNNKKDS